MAAGGRDNSSRVFRLSHGFAGNVRQRTDVLGMQPGRVL